MRKNCVFTLIWCKVRCCLCDHRRFFEHLKSFFFSLSQLPLWWMLYSCTSGVGTMPSWCVCWSELSGERLCWLSTISQSVFMCVRWSISLLTLVSQAPHSAHFLSVGQHLACCHGFIAPPVTVAVRFLFTARLKAASLFFPLSTHTHCMHMCVW